MNLSKITTVGLKHLILLLPILAFACKSNPQKTMVPLKFSDIKTIVITEDTTQRYCVYLPSAYNTQKKWPVMFMFDPHADGKLAIEQAKEAAERFGYILVGSNNSKNGAENTDHIVNVLFTDVFSHYSIDDKRVYMAGFSGGGRVASNIAMSSDKIRGVITCSAGLPQMTQQSVVRKFELYAIAGKEDFNYDEVESLPEELNGTGWKYSIAAFDGGHQWPPVNYMNQAVLWFDLNAMRDGLIPENEKLIDQTYDTISRNVDNYLNSNQYLKAEEECNKGISYMYGLHKVRTLEKKLDKLKLTEAYKLEIEKKRHVTDMEKQLRDGYLGKFTTADSSWWANEIKMLNEKTTDNKDIQTKQMYYRIKGFLGIVCYSYTSKAIGSKNNDFTKKCLKIYELLEPKNPDLFFFKALVSDKANQPEKAVELLKTAISYGFTEKTKIRDQFSKTVQKAFPL